jgi:hypothetical protein
VRSWRPTTLALATAIALLGSGNAWAQVPGDTAPPVEPVEPADPAPPVEDVPSDVDVPPPPPAGGATTVPVLPATPGRVVGVVLQGLDKVTARISTIEVPLDGTATFGTLTIRVRKCVVPPPDEKPEASAFLEIADTPPGQPAVAVFSGWMFASSPALSALEHPVYDVWVTACKTEAPGSP